MSEVLPPITDVWSRHVQRVEAIERLHGQLNYLQAQLRLEIDALTRLDTPAADQKFVGDHLALLLGESPRTMDHWVLQAQIFASQPAVVAKVADGSWSVRHADACLDETTGVGLTEQQKTQVIAALTSNPDIRTPHQVRKATRALLMLLNPDAAERQYDKVKRDRETGCADNTDGSASFWATGPKHLIAQIHACLDTMCLPRQAGDTRTLAQRRFDTLLDLVCGRAEPGQWQAYVMVRLSALTDLTGEPLLDEDGQPCAAGEIPGHGLITATEAREITVHADLRRAVVDENDQLQSLDTVLARPDAAAAPVVERLRSDAPEPTTDTALEDAALQSDEPTLADRLWLDSELTHDAVLEATVADATSTLEADLRALLTPQPVHASSTSTTRTPGPGPVFAYDLCWPTAVGVLPWHHGGGFPDRPDRDPDGDPPPVPDPDPDPEPEPEPEPPSHADLDWYLWAVPHHPTPGPIAYRKPHQPAATAGKAPSSSWTLPGLRTAVQRLLSTPADTRPLDSTAYAFPPRLSRFVKARDLTCTFPGCPLLARTCQNDHLIEWPAGPSTAHNGSSECTHHHQAKHAVFRVRRLSNGTLRWTTPGGRHIDRHPRPFLRGW